MTALSERALRRLISWARQRQGAAEFVTSSTTKPEPSQRPNGHAAISVRSPPSDHLRRAVHEARELALEDERDLAEPAVAVLGDDQVGLAGTLGGLGVVVLVAVDEDDQVGVLLDLPGLAQVAEQRALVGARLDAAGELRERDDRDLQLAGEDLQATAHLTDLLHAALDAAVGAQQLQVVDDDQAQAAV